MAGTLGTTQLLAYVSDGESAASIRGLMHRQNVRDFAVEPGTAVEATEFLKNHASPKTLIVEVPNSQDAPRLLDDLADVVHPSTRVIVTGPVDTFSFYHWLMGLGIHDYLLSPFNEQQLAAALQKGTAAATATSEAGKETKRSIAVIGARGGVGATTVATAIACAISELELPTALIDLDAQFGSVALGLDLEPSRGLRDALEKPDRIDGLFLERVMIKASPHLSILSAEEALNEHITLHANAGELLLGALREKFACTVIDVPRQLTALTRHALDQADHTVIVTEPSILALRDALRLRDLLVDTYKRPAPFMVINREGLAAKQEVPRAEFEKHLGGAPALHLPFHGEVMAATARGETMLKDGKIAGSLRAFAQQLSGKEIASKKSGLGGLLRGRK